MMKKLLIIFIFAFLLCLIFPINANAQTIKDIRNQISKLQSEKSNQNQKSETTQKQINDAKAKIEQIGNKAEETQKTKENKAKEIEQLGKDIDAKKEEIKDLIIFYQASENDNFYLKFILGAESFEDFIYRFSIAEQLTEANDNLVKEMNKLIKQNEQKIKELEETQKELDKLNKQTEEQMKKLGSEKKKYDDESLSIDEEIKTLQDQISSYKKLGCSETIQISACLNPPAASSSSSSYSSSYSGKPSAKGFILPLSSGNVSDYYGWRMCPFHGREFHSGTDISASTGTPVYASNSGAVIVARGDYKGYGNAVLIYHSSSNVTTLYGHLNSISVSPGTYVRRGQKIGTVGSTGFSTGPHLHFQAMYGEGFDLSATFSPSSLVYIPYSW